MSRRDRLLSDWHKLGDAMGQMAGFFIDEVMIRDALDTGHQARGGT